MKKQGLLPLTFNNPDDYTRVRPDDKVSLLGLTSLAPGSKVKCVLKHNDGSVDEIILDHTMNEAQIEWFKAGSALNRMAQVI